jgi:hypothetical protein
LARFEFESETVSFCFSFIFVSFEELHLLVSWCAGGRCSMTCSDENRDRSRRPDAEERGWSHMSDTRWPDGREVGWRACAVCTWHVETRSAGFLVEPQNQGRRFVSGLASKPVATVSSGLTLKPAAMVSGGLASKPAVTVFASLASKPVTMIFCSLTSKLVTTVSPGLASKPAVSFLVEPQKQGGRGFFDLGLKIDSFDLVICASKSLRLFLGLGLKTMQASIYRLCHKIDGVRSAWDTRRDLAASLACKQV